MYLTAPSLWSRSIGTGGRDASEQVVTIVGMRTGLYSAGDRAPKINLSPDPLCAAALCVMIGRPSEYTDQKAEQRCDLLNSRKD